MADILSRPQSVNYSQTSAILHFGVVTGTSGEGLGKYIFCFKNIIDRHDYYLQSLLSEYDICCMAPEGVNVTFKPIWSEHVPGHAQVHGYPYIPHISPCRVHISVKQHSSWQEYLPNIPLFDPQIISHRARNCSTFQEWCTTVELRYVLLWLVTGDLSTCYRIIWHSRTPTIKSVPSK